MKITALLTVRNESAYLERCLRHLHEQGIKACVIDNGSTDDTPRIAEAWLGRGVVRLERLRYRGCFDLTAILQNEERLAADIPADWFIHHDADEIREAPLGWGTLREAIARVDREGYNSIHFDEFVFPPLDDANGESGDYVSAMRRYYFFEPAPLRRVNAWKNTGQPVDLTSHGGHQAAFEGRKIFPCPFVLRHYIGLSRAHLAEKYGSRRFSAADLSKGWHADRARFRADRFRLPDPDRLKMRTETGEWDKSDPWLRHPFLDAA